MSHRLLASLSVVAVSLAACGEPAPRDPVPQMAPEEQRDDSAALAKLNAELAAAVKSGDTAAIDAALSAGADVNDPGEAKESLLVMAVREDKPEVVEMLISRGADVGSGLPTVTNRAGESVTDGNLLHVAAAAGAADVVPMLVGKGVQVDASNAGGDHPLHVAAAKGQADAAAALVDQGASIDAPGQGDMTALMQAAAAGHAATVSKLIEYGAGTNDRDSEDRTALALARANGHTEVVAVLEEAGAAE